MPKCSLTVAGIDLLDTGLESQADQDVLANREVAALRLPWNWTG
jgi:hypothetical protein